MRAAERRVALAAASAALLMMVVLGASAWIRFALAADAAPAGLAWVRGLHRVSATLCALAVLLLAVLAPRRAAAALVLTLALSALGIAAGTTPGPAARLGNLAGGLLLLVLLSRLAVPPPPSPGHGANATLARVAFVVALAQAGFGAWLTTLAPADPGWPLLAHAMAGLAVAALGFVLALRLFAAGLLLGPALLAASALPPVFGTVSAMLELAPGFALAHPLAAALLLALLAAADLRCAAPPRAA